MLAYLDTVIGFAVVMLGVSLVITILTQVVSAALNHRGKNLAWGLQTLFENVDPSLGTLKKQASAVADRVLTHCLISDSWFNKHFAWLRRATAIRPAELAAILEQIAKQEPPGSSLAADIDKLLAATNPAAARQVKLIEDAIAKSPALTAAVGGAAAAAQPYVKDAVEANQKTAGNLEAWFESLLDRVSQRFAMTMRIWTVIFAAAFAGVTGLNSVDLIQELHANGDFRAQLVGAAKPVSDAANDVLQGAQTPEQAVSNGLNKAYTGALKIAIENAGSTVKPPESGITTVAAAREWINGNVEPDKRAAALAALEPAADEATRTLIESDSKAAAKVRSILSKAGFEVVAFHYPEGFWHTPPSWQKAGYLLGVLATIMFLSLGAPFWFNALKSLTNLRPIVASKEQAEKKQAAAA
jgi:hypothetical protein